MTQPEETEPRWIVDYPQDVQDQITSAYRLACAAITTDAWVYDWQLRAAVKKAFAEYVEMRSEYRKRAAWLPD
mgnify:CR=1 FL=1